MIEHLVFISYLIIFISSTIGYGFIFSKILKNDFVELNLGYQGLLGFFFLSFLSILTSFFLPHNFFHNSFIHLIGLTFFVIFVINKKKFTELKYLVITFSILLLGIYVFKNHDDFPYYHLTYALNLSENGYAVGLGNFSHGFRTVSSLFYIHSLFYMPIIEFYLFHLGPFLILLFFNIIILSRLFKNFKKIKIDFLYYFSLLAFIFVNVVFYRLGEHGTDRSSQILLLLIFILFFQILLYDQNYKKVTVNLYLLIITILLAASIKVIYYLYIILIPILLLKKNFLNKFFSKNNRVLIGIAAIFLSINLLTSYLNTGCLVYPSEKTCFGNKEWSIPKDEVKGLSIHYEWWAKAGGGPSYRAELEPKEYIKNFKWLNNWIDKHFFNKVSDTLLGILAMSMLLFFTLKYFSKKGKFTNKYNLVIDKNSLIIMYIIPFIFFMEWFLNHPAMRYGGFVLFALPIFIFSARQMDKIKILKNDVYKITIFFVILTFVVFNYRNLVRINKEINFYGYNIVESPFFYVDKSVESYPLDTFEDYTIYSLKNGSYCWAAKTPCSNSKSVRIKEFLWMKMFYKKK
ncbi:hypothetical protein OAQ48_05320 [Candidatus Pelagibacter sp.]|jgi:hypothetical protein|nr:hypothetical protein [Candidatus Pelagibacter sp.]